MRYLAFEVHSCGVCGSSGSGKWYKFDDSTVSLADERSLQRVFGKSQASTAYDAGALDEVQAPSIHSSIYPGPTVPAEPSPLMPAVASAPQTELDR